MPPLTTSGFNEDTVFMQSTAFNMIPTDTGILVDGGPELEIVSGQLALSLIPVILPLIDGTRTFREVVALVPNIPESDVREAITRLYLWGLLARKATAPAKPQEMQNLLAYLSRHAPGTEPEPALIHLQGTAITIFCVEAVCFPAEDLRRLLINNGFSHVSIAEPNILRAAANTLHISIVDDTLDSGAKAKHYQKLEQCGSPWLRTTFNRASGYYEIGPLFREPEQLCFSCLTEIAPVATVDSLCEETHFWSMFSALIATETTHAVSRSFSRKPGLFFRLLLPWYEHNQKRWPSASECSVGLHRRTSYSLLKKQRPQGTPGLLPLLFDEILQQGQLDKPVQHGDVVRSTTRPFRLLNSSRIVFEEKAISLTGSLSDSLAMRECGAAAYLLIDRLASLLALSVGHRTDSSGSPQRWTPTAGNLGSVEMYLVANDEAILDVGVYMYQPNEHALAQLKSQGADKVRELFASLSPTSLSPMLLVVTGSYSQLAPKYGSFAYKLIHLDAGVACSQVLTTGTALGMKIQSVSKWSSRTVEQVLGLHCPDEVAIQMFQLLDDSQPKKGFDDCVDTNDNSNYMTTSPTLDTPFEDLLAAELVPVLVQEQRIIMDRLPTSVKMGKVPYLRRARSGLSSLLRRRVSLGYVMNTRASTRRFTKRVPEMSQIEEMLDLACSNNVFIGSGLSVTACIREQLGYGARLFEYDLDANKLVSRRTCITSSQLEGVFAQAGYGDTPVVFIIAASVRAFSTDRADIYQTLLLRAGFVGHRLWLASIDQGCSGVLIAGITSRSSEVLSISGHEKRRPLLAFLCGYPTKQSKMQEELL